MSFPQIPDDYLEDIVKTFLLGIRTEFIDEQGNKIPDIIARYYSKEDPRYFPYIVEWKTLFKLRKNIIRVLKNSKNTKLINLANAIEDTHI